MQRNETLSYRSSSLEAPQNTILHDAIINDDLELALHVITQDSSAFDGQSIINNRSLGNTALLLALKTGSMTIAEALLRYPAIDIHITDERGLTALHWACMLRQDRIITPLLDKGADPRQVVPAWAASGIDEPDEMTPLNLYQRDISAHHLGRYVELAQEAVKFMLNPRAFSSKYPAYGCCFFYADGGRLLHRSGFTDRPDLHIPGEMAYTDIVFHMAPLCRNLGWSGTETVFVSPEEVTRSSAMFAENFFLGYGDFCRYRNELKPDAELLERMGAGRIRQFLP